MSPNARASKRRLQQCTSVQKSPASVAAAASPKTEQAANEGIPEARGAPELAQRATSLPGTVKLRGQNGKIYDLVLPAKFQKAAEYWGYVLRNRIRWSQNPEVAKKMTERAIRLLEDMGLREAQRAEIVEAGVVEIDIPFLSEGMGWEVRVFPWEFVLGAARDERLSLAAQKFSTPLIVVRHICC